jgi:cell division protein FtsL
MIERLKEQWKDLSKRGKIIIGVIIIIIAMLIYGMF